MHNHPLIPFLSRIADALEILAPPMPSSPDFAEYDGFIWQTKPYKLRAVDKISAIPLELLVGIEHVKDILLNNTERFASGFPANNALIWGARGMGKSSLVKGVHREMIAKKYNLKLIEIQRDDLETLPILLNLLRGNNHKFLLFCDDLSFDVGENSYKSLKAVLDGGIEGRPDNVLFYATSNRRHLIPRDMIENERSTAINPHEAVEEKVSLSDRFGLWLGLYVCDQESYLQMVDSYAKYFSVFYDKEKLHKEALEWAITRGSRSGRVAWQFITDLLGRGK